MSEARAAKNDSELGEWETWWIETDTSMTSREARSQDEARQLYEAERSENVGTVRLVCDYFNHRKRRKLY